MHKQTGSIIETGRIRATVCNVWESTGPHSPTTWTKVTIPGFVLFYLSACGARRGILPPLQGKLHLNSLYICKYACISFRKLLQYWVSMRHFQMSLVIPPQCSLLYHDTFNTSCSIVLFSLYTPSVFNPFPLKSPWPPQGPLLISWLLWVLWFFYSDF